MKKFTKGKSIKIIFDDGSMGHGVIIDILDNGLYRVGFNDGHVLDLCKYRFCEYEEDLFGKTKTSETSSACY
jgi:hypothetical protein